MFSIVVCAAMLCGPILPVEAEPAPTQSVAVDGPYRWQLAVFDLANISSTILAAKFERPALVGNVALYALGPSIFHLVHHHRGRALASALLRVGLPFGLAVAGGQAAKCRPSDDDCSGADGVAVGLLVGLTVAMVIDDAVIAYDPEPAPVQSAPHRGTGFAIAPTVGVTGQSTQIGFVGQF